MQICVLSRVFRSVLLALGVAALAGCSLFATKNPRYDPAPLTEYSAGISAHVAWSAAIGMISAMVCPSFLLSGVRSATACRAR